MYPCISELDCSIQQLKVTGTRVCHAITVTRFMQRMLILTLRSTQLVLNSNLSSPAQLLTDEGLWLHDALAPPTAIHKF